MTEELVSKMPSYTTIVSANPNVKRNKQVVVKFEIKSPNVVSEGKQPQTKSFGGIFSYYNAAGNLVERCFYDQIDGSPEAPFIIDGLVVLDLMNPVHFANYLTLKDYIKLYPESSEGIEIIDQEERNELNIVTEEQLLMVKSRLVMIKNDIDELKKMYRRLVGSVEGVTKEAIYSRLFQLIDEDRFKVAEYFEKAGNEQDKIKAIIDLAKEKGIVASSSGKEGYHTIVGTGAILGNTYDNAVIRLLDDKELLADIKSMLENINRPKPSLLEVREEVKKELSSEWNIDELAKELVVSSNPEDIEFHLEQKDEKAMEEFINNLTKKKIIVLDGKKYNSQFLPINDMSKRSLIEAFQKNNSLIRTAKQYARQ